MGYNQTGWGFETCDRIYVDLRSNIKTCSFKDEFADFDYRCSNEGACTYEPKKDRYVCDYDLWKINKATLKTAYLAEGTEDQDQCSMTVNILSDPTYKDRLATPLDVRCINPSGSTNTVMAEFGDLNRASGLVQVWAQLRGTFMDTVGYWYGELTLEGTRPSMNEFSAMGKNYVTQQSQTVGAGETLEICKGTSVNLKWGTQHASDVTVFVGSPQKVYRSISGNETFTPAVNTNIYIGGAGYAGYEYKQFFFEDPINIKLHDCGECNPALSNPSGTNNACIAKYPGEGRFCCNVNVCNACGGGTHMACNNNNACVSVSGGGNDECSSDANCGDQIPTPIPPIPTGSLEVKITMNGQEITDPVSVNYRVLGPQSINDNQAPKIFSNIEVGTYNVSYVDSGQF